MSCVQCTVSVKLIHQNGPLSDQQRYHHIDMAAQSKRDKKTWTKTETRRSLWGLKIWPPWSEIQPLSVGVQTFAACQSDISCIFSSGHNRLALAYRTTWCHIQLNEVSEHQIWSKSVNIWLSYSVSRLFPVSSPTMTLSINYTSRHLTSQNKLISIIIWPQLNE